MPHPAESTLYLSYCSPAQSVPAVSSSCTSRSRVQGRKAQHTLQHQRYAPYTMPPAAAVPCSDLQQQAQQLQQLQACCPSTSTLQRCKMLLQLAIGMANSSLEATLQHFNTACTAHPNSMDALAALDAAEAAMAQTTRMTNIATCLAQRCLLQSSSMANASALQCMQAAGACAGQEVQPAGGAVLGFGPLPAGMALQQQLVVVGALGAEDDVEEGEEVSSSCCTRVSSSSPSVSFGGNLP